MTTQWAIRLYEYLSLARGRVFDWVRPLSDADYVRPFPIGLGSLARTLTHTFVSEWYYIERLTKANVPPYAEWTYQDEKPPPFTELERAWRAQSKRTAAALASVQDWNERIEYRVMDDDGKPSIVCATPADIFSQLVVHEAHHRAQAMSTLRQLGVASQDIDFNTLMYVRCDAPTG